VHADNEPIFNAMKQPVNILSLSIGEERTFIITGKHSKKGDEPLKEIELPNLSYYFCCRFSALLPWLS